MIETAEAMEIPAAILHLDDFERAVRLMVEVVKRLDERTVAQIRGA